ncbi:hypothetical protein HDV00_004065 [Rhizophlyctis rosea]|nr:hypothetical protein HDV00_004065 [Rhizophlyctis rosea]
MASSILRYLLFQLILTICIIEHPLPLPGAFDSALNLLPHLHHTAAPRQRVLRAPVSNPRAGKGNQRNPSLARRQAADPLATTPVATVPPAVPTTTEAPVSTTAPPAATVAPTTTPPPAATVAPTTSTTAPVASTTSTTAPTTQTTSTTSTTRSQTSQRSTTTTPTSEWVMATRTAYTYLPQTSVGSGGIKRMGDVGWTWLVAISVTMLIAFGAMGP